MLTPAAQASRKIRDLLMGAAVTRALQVAGELAIADALGDTTCEVEDLAGQLSLDAASLRRLLRLLASQGIFSQEADGRFRNTPLSDCLRAGHPHSLRDLACALADDGVWRAWEGVTESIRLGGAAMAHVHGLHLFEYLSAHPESGRRFAAAMASSARLLNAALVESHPWDRYGVIADIGGGNGTTLIHLLRRAVHARGWVFDLPAVAPLAREAVSHAGLTARCEVAQGSFFDPLAIRADACLLKLVLHDWGDAECIRILTHCRQALSGSGRVLICERLLTHTGTDQYAHITDFVMLSLTRAGRERRRDEYEQLLARAGLRLAQVHPVDGEMFLLEAQANPGPG